MRKTDVFQGCNRLSPRKSTPQGRWVAARQPVGNGAKHAEDQKNTSGGGEDGAVANVNGSKAHVAARKCRESISDSVEQSIDVWGRWKQPRAAGPTLGQNWVLRDSVTYRSRQLSRALLSPSSLPTARAGQCLFLTPFSSCVLLAASSGSFHLPLSPHPRSLNCSLEHSYSTVETGLLSRGIPHYTVATSRHKFLRETKSSYQV
jgi:hypothetical protein